MALSVDLATPVLEFFLDCDVVVDLMVHDFAARITPLQTEQRDALASMLRRSWLETYRPELGEVEAAALIDTLYSQDIGGVIPGDDETVLVATHEDEIIGCAVSAARHGVLYLWGFYMLAHFQRRGIGRALLERSVSAHPKADNVQLTVLKSSLGAVEFYRSLGFGEETETGFDLLPTLKVSAITMTAPAIAFRESFSS